MRAFVKRLPEIDSRSRQASREEESELGTEQSEQQQRYQDPIVVEVPLQRLELPKPSKICGSLDVSSGDTGELINSSKAPKDMRDSFESTNNKCDTSQLFSGRENTLKTSCENVANLPDRDCIGDSSR